MGDAERSAEGFRVDDGVLFAFDFFGLVAALSNVVRVHQVFTGASDLSIFQLQMNKSIENESIVKQFPSIYTVHIIIKKKFLLFDLLLLPWRWCCCCRHFGRRFGFEVRWRRSASSVCRCRPLSDRRTCKRTPGPVPILQITSAISIRWRNSFEKSRRLNLNKWN